MSLALYTRQLWLPGITHKKLDHVYGVREWLGSGQWTLNKKLGKNRAEIALHSIEDYVDAMLCDAIRQAAAAFESARAANFYPGEPRSYAWQFIPYYYAGYFAANALMRLCGYASINFYAGECSEINQQGMLLNLGGISDKDKITPGVYYLSANLSGTPSVSFSQVGGKGGVHIQFWIAFTKFLDELNHSIGNANLLTQADRTAALNELNDLKAGLKHSNTQSGAWLSEVRNAMNYRLEYGEWFPYDGSQTDGVSIKAALCGAIKGIHGIPKSNAKLPDPTRAVRLSGFLLSWLRSSFSTLEATSTGKVKKLISDGVLKIANCIK